MLLVLDNCSHVVATVGQICAALLEYCPNLSVLASSRELLRVPGESVYVVPALALPHDEDQLESSAAVQLFIQRAIARGYDLDGQIDQVARVVRRLEGMPLAIELAAARTNVMTVEELASELETSFTILAGGSRTASPRQQSMYGAIEWSHDLLTPAERDVFAQLSVFVGGWTLSAAATVMSGQPSPGPLERAEALDLTGRLVDKSLIRVTRRSGVARYYMLAVIREFAADRLIAGGMAEEAARRHAQLLHHPRRGGRGPVARREPGAVARTAGRRVGQRPVRHGVVTADKVGARGTAIGRWALALLLPARSLRRGRSVAGARIGAVRDSPCVGDGGTRSCVCEGEPGCRDACLPAVRVRRRDRTTGRRH